MASHFLQRSPRDMHRCDMCPRYFVLDIADDAQCMGCMRLSRGGDLLLSADVAMCMCVQPLLGEAVAAVAGRSVPSPIHVAGGSNGTAKTEEDILKRKQARTLYVLHTLLLDIYWCPSPAS